MTDVIHQTGATCSIFPFDQNASEYLRKTGREEIASLAQMNAAELRADDEDVFRWDLQEY